jgi:hypothetical protein
MWPQHGEGQRREECTNAQDYKNEMRRENCGKSQFLVQYQKGYIALRILNKSSNNFLRWVPTRRISGTELSVPDST